ncbi:ubiquitin supergroup domain-containing protein [Colletotrichum tofieldiae]|uniref:Ubiquitin supergroup domain-containing protein n=1 Tax=Colletotrichum tofieldiae TaxID=708197 RepID=A0A166YBB5_9PEZI|nr:ubiquitin supergroup domain-containing protein [Colletotrichum tofieldiae]GKT87053.1 ubiquitin supergroup domain-containing protein [Colletotrichum tofieldiae]
MAEVVFARQFLSILESRPAKLSADHVEDPKNFPARPPYILPKMPKPMSKPTNLAPGQERSINVALKSLRNPPLDIKLSSQTLNTSILDIKTAVETQSRIPVDKMKLLYNKKPVPDSKVLKDLLTDDQSSLEFSVMVIGGAAAVKPEPAPVGGDSGSQEDIGEAALDTPEFWNDLKGFLMQRLKHEQKAEELSALWRSTWQAQKKS